MLKCGVLTWRVSLSISVDNKRPVICAMCASSHRDNMQLDKRDAQKARTLARSLLIYI